MCSQNKLHFFIISDSIKKSYTELLIKKRKQELVAWWLYGIMSFSFSNSRRLRLVLQQSQSRQGNPAKKKKANKA